MLEKQLAYRKKHISHKEETHLNNLTQSDARANRIKS